jgi:hypothetical protein
LKVCCGCGGAGRTASRPAAGGCAIGISAVKVEKEVIDGDPVT